MVQGLHLNFDGEPIDLMPSSFKNVEGLHIVENAAASAKELS